MNPVNVTILNKNYAIACTPEDEPMIHQCAAYVNEQLYQRRSATGIGDSSHAMVLTLLVMASEIMENRALQEGTQNQPTSQANRQAISPDALKSLTLRIKTVAKNLQDFHSEQ